MNTIVCSQFYSKPAILFFSLWRGYLDLALAFGKVLKQKRNEAGYSQEKLAELCSLERTYISFLERGERKPSLNMTFRFADVFGMKASDLVGAVENEMKQS